MYINLCKAGPVYSHTDLRALVYNTSQILCMILREITMFWRLATNQRSLHVFVVRSEDEGKSKGNQHRHHE